MHYSLSYRNLKSYQFKSLFHVHSFIYLVEAEKQQPVDCILSLTYLMQNHKTFKNVYIHIHLSETRASCSEQKCFTKEQMCFDDGLLMEVCMQT